MEMEQAQKKRKKREINPVITEIPRGCPYPGCDSLKRRVVGTRVFPRRPLLIDGTMYKGLRIRRVQCKDCNRFYIVRTPLKSGKPPKIDPEMAE